MENSEIDSHKYSQLIFDKGQSQLDEAQIVFSTNDSGKMDICI